MLYFFTVSTKVDNQKSNAVDIMSIEVRETRTKAEEFQELEVSMKETLIGDRIERMFEGK